MRRLLSRPLPLDYDDAVRRGHGVGGLYGPYFTVLMRNPTELVRVLEKVEEAGYREDMCSAMRCHLGQTLLGMTPRNPWGGEVVPDFIFQFYFCHSAIKMAQIQSEELGIPCFISLTSPIPLHHNDIEYMVTQFHEAIEWMEKTTGKKFDDEKFFEGLRNEWQSMTLWPQFSVLCKTYPFLWMAGCAGAEGPGFGH